MDEVIHFNPDNQFYFPSEPELIAPKRKVASLGGTGGGKFAGYFQMQDLDYELSEIVFYVCGSWGHSNDPNIQGLDLYYRSFDDSNRIEKLERRLKERDYRTWGVKDITKISLKLRQGERIYQIWGFEGGGYSFGIKIFTDCGQITDWIGYKPRKNETIKELKYLCSSNSKEICDICGGRGVIVDYLSVETRASSKYRSHDQSEQSLWFNISLARLRLYLYQRLPDDILKCLMRSLMIDSPETFFIWELATRERDDGCVQRFVRSYNEY